MQLGHCGPCAVQQIPMLGEEARLVRLLLLFPAAHMVGTMCFRYGFFQDNSGREFAQYFQLLFLINDMAHYLLQRTTHSLRISVAGLADALNFALTVPIGWSSVARG